MSDIVLKDKSGVKNTYNNINAINIPDGNGGFVKYSLGGTHLPEYDGTVIIEKATEGIVGTWVFNEELIKSEVQVSDASDVYFNCDYSLDYNDTQVTFNKIRLYGYYGDKLLQLFYCKDDEELQVYAYVNLNTPTWDWSNVGIDKVIHITREPTDENFKTWLKANATKTEGVSV